MTATGIGPPFDETLARVYRRATDLGLLGPREADHVIERSMAFVDALMRSNERDGLESGPPRVTLAAPLRVADLGSGAGVPGLVVAVGLPGSSVDFVEISGRRCAFLRWAIRELDESGQRLGAASATLADRCTVMHMDASQAGHDPANRERYDAVVARSFRSPAVTAEVASGLLRVGGSLFVSGTPTDEDRWPAASLAMLGLVVTSVDDAGQLRIRRFSKRGVGG